MFSKKKSVLWNDKLRVKPGDVVIYENSYYLNKNGINSNPLNDSNWLYLGDVSKKVLDFTFSNDGTLGNGFNKPLDNVRNLSFSGDDFEYELDENEEVLLIKQNQKKQQENIPKLVTLTLVDLGMTSSNTEEEINQALADYINGLNLTIGEKELYFFQVATDTIKKTYLIKDQGKGLVENLTPDKLFDISSGGSGGNIDLKWENITGDQKTVRLEDFQDGGERYFLEKIINSNVSDICNNDENNILVGIIDGNLHYSTDNFVTSTQVLSNVNGIFKENNSLYTTVFHFNQLGEPSLSLYSSIDGINWVNENLTFNPDEAAINLRIVNGQLTIFESIPGTGTKIHTHINGIWSYQEIPILVDNIINLGGVPYYHYNTGPIKHAFFGLYDVTTLAIVFSYSGGTGDTFADIFALDNDVFIASFTKYPGLLRAYDANNFNQLSDINLPEVYKFFRFIDKTIAVCQDGIAEITYDLVNGLKYKFFNLSLNIYDITYGSNVGDDILLTIYNDGVQAIRYENGLKFENTIEEINFNGVPVEVFNKVADIRFENTDSDYSIDEIKTSATWINGKPIYRKVIPFNTPELSYLGNLTITHNCNVSTYIKADIINTGLNTDALVTFPLASLNNSFTPNLPFFLSSGIINMTSNEIVFNEIQAKDGERTTDSFLILEYTKNI